jgi:putative acetyltransferase
VPTEGTGEPPLDRGYWRFPLQVPSECAESAHERSRPRQRTLSADRPGLDGFLRMKPDRPNGRTAFGSRARNYRGSYEYAERGAFEPVAKHCERSQGSGRVAPGALVASPIVVRRLNRHPEMEQETSWEVTVRPAVSADAVAIIDLHFAAVHRTASTFYTSEVLDNWSPQPNEARYQQMQEIIAGDEELVLVAEDTLGVVAFGSIVPRLRELRAVYVHPNAGRRGVGTQVLAALERLALERGIPQLQMVASVNAEAFYRRAGYEVVESGTHRLRSGQEMACVKMAKHLAT